MSGKTRERSWNLEMKNEKEIYSNKTAAVQSDQSLLLISNILNLKNI